MNNSVKQSTSTARNATRSVGAAVKQTSSNVAASTSRIAGAAAQANQQIAQSSAAATAQSAARARAISQGFVQQSTMTVRGPLAQLTNDIEKQNLTLRRAATAWRNRHIIMAESKAGMMANGDAIMMTNGKLKVLFQSQGAVIARTATLAERFKYLTQQMRMAAAMAVAVGQNMIRTGKQIQWAGRQILVGIGMPMLLISSLATRYYEEYNKWMTRVVKVTRQTVSANTEAFRLQEESVERQVAKLAELGATMGFLAETTAEAVASFAQMGFMGFELESLSETAMRLALVSGAEMETAVQMTRVAYQAFGIELDKITESYARLNLIENNTAISLAELADSLPIVANVMKGVGVSIEETSAMLAIMKTNGVAAREGATALRTGIIRLVQDATDPAIVAFNKLGINIVELQGAFKGDVLGLMSRLGDELDNLEGSGENAQKLSDDFVAALGKMVGTRQASRFLGLLKEMNEGTAIVNAAQAEFNKLAEEDIDYVTKMTKVRAALTEKGFDLNSIGARAFIGVWADSTAAMQQYDYEQRKVMESAAGQAQILRAKMGLELKKIGELTLEMVNNFRRSFIEIMKWFNGLSERTRKLVISMATLMTILAVLIMTFGVLTNLMGQIIRLSAGIFASQIKDTRAVRASQIAWDKLAQSIGLSTKASLANTTATKATVTQNLLAAKAASQLAKQQSASAVAAGVSRGGRTGAALSSIGSMLFGRSTRGIAPRFGGQAPRFFQDVHNRRAAAVTAIQSAGPKTQSPLPMGWGSGSSFAAPAPITPSQSRSATRKAFVGASRASAGAAVAKQTKKIKDFGTAATGIFSLMGAKIKTVGSALSNFGKNFLSIGGRILKIFGGVLKLLFKIPFIIVKIMTTAVLMNPWALAILAVIGLILVAFKNWSDVVKGFKSTAGGTFTELKNTFVGIWEMIKQVVSTMMEGFGQAGGLAETLGKVLGLAFKGIALAIKVIIDVVLPPLLGAFKFLMGIIQAIVKLFQGDFKGALSSVGNAIKDLFMGVLDGIIGYIKGLLRPLSEMDNALGRLAKKAMEGLPDTMSETAEKIGEAVAKTADLREELDKNKEILEETDSILKESNEVVEDMIKHRMISGKESAEALVYESAITDEQLEQIWIAQNLPIHQQRMNDLVDEQARLEEYITQLEIERLSLLEAGNRAQREAIELRIRQQRALFEDNARRTQAEIDRYNNSMDSFRVRVSRVRNTTSQIAEDMGDTADETERAADAANEFMSALKSAMGEAMSDINKALDGILSKQSQAIDKYFDTIEKGMDKYFDEFGSGFSDAFDKMTEKIDEQFELEMEGIESTFELESKRLDDIEKALEEQERLRQRFFEAEKARIDYLSGKQISGIKINEALASGDITGAAILRIQQEAAARKFIEETTDRERQSSAERRKQEIEEIRRLADLEKSAAVSALEARKEASLEAVRVARQSYADQVKIAQEAAAKLIAAAQDAAAQAEERERIRIENYLREWQRITPQTEEEYQKHLQNLNDFLNQSGQRLDAELKVINDGLKAELGELAVGFTDTTGTIQSDMIAILTDNQFFTQQMVSDLTSLNLSAVNETLGAAAAFTAGFQNAIISSQSLASEFARVFLRNIADGFSYATDLAARMIAEDSKWAAAGKRAADAFNSAYQNNLTKDPSIVVWDGWMADMGSFSGTTVRMHDGGPVLRTNLSERLNNVKPDEVLRVLQAGEYVMSKEAVDAIGLPALAAMNSLKNKGMAVKQLISTLGGGKNLGRDFGSIVSSMPSRSDIGNPDVFPPMPIVHDDTRESYAYSYNMNFNIDGNVDANDIAKKVMFEIKRTERNVGTGRTIG